MKVSWPVALIPWALVAILAYAAWAISSAPSPMACVNAQQAAAISLRAANVCSQELPGCRLTYTEVRAVIAEQEAAKVCQ